MKHRFVFFLLGLAFVCALTPVEAGARPDKGKNIYGHFATGWMMPEGDFGKIVDDEWYFDGGILYWPKDWGIGLNFDLAYTNTDIKSSVIAAINNELAMLGAGAIVVFKQDTTEFSWNAGVGVTFERMSGSQIFIEARYKSAQTDPRTTEYIPIVVGFRW